MQVSLDGFVGAPDGNLDWMEWNWDAGLNSYVADLTKSVDTILLGRKLAETFIPYWQTAAFDPKHRDHASAGALHETAKVVFSKKLAASVWPNTTVAKKDLIEEVNDLKRRHGKDIVVYGGAEFVSNLIRFNLIDDYHLFINPVVISQGLTIFREVPNTVNLRLVKSTSFDCGIVGLHYHTK